MRTLYHITVRLPTRDEHVGAEAMREERTYTAFGGRQLGRRLAWCIERHPGTPPKVERQAPSSRSPICP